MKTLSDYHNDLYTLLGDAFGRRYTAAVLNMALEEALKTFGEYWPNKSSMETTVSGYEGPLAVLEEGPGAGTEILTVKRKNSGQWLPFAWYRGADQAYLGFYGNGPRPETGETLILGLAEPHTIEGLNGETETTVPDAYAGIVEKGAAAEALRIRARSVTEVFGKRPEDTEHLTAQAEALDTAFFSALAGLAADEQMSRDPWPLSGFPI